MLRLKDAKGVLLIASLAITKVGVLAVVNKISDRWTSKTHRDANLSRGITNLQSIKAADVLRVVHNVFLRQFALYVRRDT